VKGARRRAAGLRVTIELTLFIILVCVSIFLRNRTNREHQVNIGLVISLPMNEPINQDAQVLI
jgi:hypothetical protein